MYSAPTVSNTLGAILIGTLMSATLSGIMSTQTFLYVRAYPADPLRNQIVIFLLWFLDTIHTCLVCAATWIYLVSNFGSGGIEQYIPWSIAASMALTGVIIFVSNWYLLSRIRLMSKSWWFPTVPISLFAMLRFSTTLLTCTEMIKLKRYDLYINDFGWVFTLGLSVSSAVDIAITSSLAIFLHKSRTGFSTSTDKLVVTIILYTVETGMITCIMTITSLVCWLTMRHNLIFLAIHFCISKMYANTVLAMLNARKSLRDRTSRRQPNSQVTSLPIISFGSRRPSETELEEDHELSHYISPNALDTKPYDASSTPADSECPKITRVKIHRADQPSEDES
ncbi:hypothetical protein B0H21DRAFT_749248 [Amylocystis lapponica]|nr:hypothetical protein B0H21DRAFT_749248 [Amylocystis lapponica]